MFGRRKQIEEQLNSIQDLLVELRHDSELLHTVLVIREPDTVTAANAYEGLRKQIVAVAQEHWAHLAQLVEIDMSINHTDSVEVTRGLVDDWLARAGIRRIQQVVDSRQLAELFEDLGGSGSVIETRSPAYVDSATGRIIRKGRLTRVAPAPAEPVSQERSDTDEPGVPGLIDNAEDDVNSDAEASAVAAPGGVGSERVSEPSDPDGEIEAEPTASDMQREGE